LFSINHWDQPSFLTSLYLVLNQKFAKNVFGCCAFINIVSSTEVGIPSARQQQRFGHFDLRPALASHRAPWTFTGLRPLRAITQTPSSK
jgi:hypothetical protein